MFSSDPKAGDMSLTLEALILNRSELGLMSSVYLALAVRSVGIALAMSI